MVKQKIAKMFLSEADVILVWVLQNNFYVEGLSQQFLLDNPLCLRYMSHLCYLVSLRSAELASNEDSKLGAMTHSAARFITPQPPSGLFTTA